MAVVLYPLLVYAAVSTEQTWLAVAAAGIVAAHAIQTIWLRRTIVAAITLVSLGLWSGAADVPSMRALAFAPPTLINLGLAWVFARTLRSGQQPLLAMFSRLEQGGVLPADLAHHARRMTLAWACFAATMAIVSFVLAALGWLTAWSWFTGIANYLLAALLFVGEYQYRRTRYAHYQHFGLLQMRQYIGLLTQRGITGNAIPLLHPHRLSDSIAWRNGTFISVGLLLGHAQALAQHLPQQGYVLNVCRDRYHFTVTFLAAIIARKVSLLPPSLALTTLDELCADYGDVCCVADHHDVPQRVIAVNIENCSCFEPANAIPHIEEDRIVAILFTSGSTGRPAAHQKTWGALVQGARSLGTQIKFARHVDRVVLGSVPPQHMFGLETTIMLPLQCGGVVHAGWPLLPSDIHAAASLLQRCWLMTTPLQLRACAEQVSEDAPRFAGIISSTMPLSESLAERIEARYGCTVREIYGCTEVGMIATRRTTQVSAWTLVPGLRLRIAGERATVDGGHAPRPHRLDDRLLAIAQHSFMLLGRDSDLVKIGGKRTSLEALNHALRETPGVEDAVFFIPPLYGDTPVRPIAFAIAPGCTQDEILRHLRQRLDPVFLPRPLHLVEVLPRTATGKISSVGLTALAQTLTRALPSTDLMAN